MMINIQNYEILNFPTDDLIVSKRGVSRINSPALLAALTKLKIIKIFQELHSMRYCRITD
jgi:McbB family protein